MTIEGLQALLIKQKVPTGDLGIKYGLAPNKDIFSHKLNRDAIAHIG